MINNNDTFTIENNKTLTKTSINGEKDDWGTVQDFDNLFDACVSRWGSNWNLEKVVAAIHESELD